MNPNVVAAIGGAVVVGVFALLVRAISQNSKEAGAAEVVAEVAVKEHEEQIVGDLEVAVARDPGFASEQLHAGGA